MASQSKLNPISGSQNISSTTHHSRSTAPGPVVISQTSSHSKPTVAVAPSKIQPQNQQNSTSDASTGESEADGEITAKTPPLATASVTASGKIPTQSHTSTLSSPTVPIYALVGAVLAAVVLTGLCIFYFRVLRRKRRKRVARSVQLMTTSTGNGPFYLLRPRQDTEAQNLVRSADSLPPKGPQQQHSSMTKGSQISPAEATSSLTTLASAAEQSVDLVPAERGNGRTGRRAVDAGPVSHNAEAEAEEEDDGASTLPPEYGDIFTVSSRYPTGSSKLHQVFLP